MRTITLFIASSLDNFIAREDGAIDWLFTDGDFGYKQFYDSIDTVFMGRKTYDTAVRLGEHFENKICYVFSRTKQKSTGNIHFRDDPVSVAKRLVHEQGKGIFLEGGGEIISVFLKEKLIDNMILSIHPVILGSGIPLFPEIDKQVNLKLLNCTRFDNGLVQLNYEVLR